MDQDLPIYIFIGVMIIVDIGLIWFLKGKLAGYKKLQSHEALQTKATITRKYKRNNKNSVSYMTQFTFRTWNNETIKGSSSMSRDKWDSLNEGDVIEIKYVRENPKIHCEIESIDRMVKTFSMLIPIVLICMGAAPIFIVVGLFMTQ